jgi:hypothetical protein
MVESARAFKPRHLRRVYFVAFEEEMYRAFEAAGVTAPDAGTAKA